MERGFFEVSYWGFDAYAPKPWGLLAPKPLGFNPLRKGGLTPAGKVKKCRTSIDNEQPLHGYRTALPDYEPRHTGLRAGQRDEHETTEFRRKVA